MTLSKETLDILNNFSVINQSILVHAGDKLSTISASKNILAEAGISETFAKDFAIYDLPKFLGVLRLYEEPEFELSEGYMIIRNAKNTRQYTRYYFSDPSVVIAPPSDKSVQFPDEVTIEFTISQKDLQNIVKGCAIMSLPQVNVKGEDGQWVIIEGLDTGNPAMGTFNQELEVASEGNFSFIIEIDSLSKVMQGDYTVSISEDGIARFVNKQGDLKYFIAVTLGEDDDDE